MNPAYDTILSADAETRAGLFTARSLSGWLMLSA